MNKKDMKYVENCIDAGEKHNNHADAEILRLREALQLLYDETADYIVVNNLGDIHHNRSMQLARKALNLTSGVSYSNT